MIPTIREIELQAQVNRMGDQLNTAAARVAELEAGIRLGVETIKGGSAIRALPILENLLTR